MQLAPFDSRVKDPRLVAAGKKAMRARWGPPRTARLDELDPVARRIVTLIIEADRRDRENAKAAPALDPDAALPEVHCHARPGA